MKALPYIVLGWGILCLVIAFPVHQIFYELNFLVLGGIWLFSVGGYFLVEWDSRQEKVIE